MSKQPDTIDVFSLPVFPAANAFRMLRPEELNTLAADIKENGLIDPIVIAEMHDKETGEVIDVLVDGRNRREACRIARVTPNFRRLNGEDPTLFVLRQNLNRRFISAGQRALGAVLALKNNPPIKKIEKKDIAVTINVSRANISFADAICEYAPDLIDPVVEGDMSLKEAWDKWQERKREKETDEAKAADLKKRYPELAQDVEEGKWSLKAALVEADDRDERKRQTMQTHLSVCKAAMSNVAKFAAEAHATSAEKTISEILSSDEYTKEFDINRKEFAKQVKAFKGGLPRLVEILDAILETAK